MAIVIPLSRNVLGVAVRPSRVLAPSFRAFSLAAKTRLRPADTQPTRAPFGVRRWSALSARKSSRYSAREVNMR